MGPGRPRLAPAPPVRTEAEETEALAAAWPRILIAAGVAEPLAEWWRASRQAAIAAGQPGFARSAAEPRILELLFEARRARRLIRGFEAVEEALAAQQKGLRRAPATRVAGERRISRLLVLSGDGAKRFYRNADILQQRHADRLEVLVLDCDEVQLGEAVYGPGQRMRAALLDHKEVVVEMLAAAAGIGEDATAARELPPE